MGRRGLLQPSATRPSATNSRRPAGRCSGTRRPDATACGRPDFSELESLGRMSTSQRPSAAATPQPTRVTKHNRHRVARCTRDIRCSVAYPAHSPDSFLDVLCVLCGLPARSCGWAGGSLVEQADGSHAEPEAESERDGGPAEGWVEGGGKLGACQGAHVGEAPAKARNVPASSRIRPAGSRPRRSCQTATTAATQPLTEIMAAYLDQHRRGRGGERPDRVDHIGGHRDYRQRSEQYKLGASRRPAGPARLGVAIKEPPPVRLIGTLESLRIPRPEGKMTPTASKPSLPWHPGFGGESAVLVAMGRGPVAPVTIPPQRSRPRRRPAGPRESPRGPSR